MVVLWNNRRKIVRAMKYNFILDYRTASVIVVAVACLVVLSLSCSNDSGDDKKKKSAYNYVGTATVYFSFLQPLSPSDRPRADALIRNTINASFFDKKLSVPSGRPERTRNNILSSPEPLSQDAILFSYVLRSRIDRSISFKTSLRIIPSPSAGGQRESIVK